MIKIAHEAPIAIFNRVQQLTSYDYALVHLFEESEQYYDNFKTSVDIGREVILDNSIFELGTAFNARKYAEWIERLRPTYYIIPDVLEDMVGTLDNFDKWMSQYKDLPGQTIAVAQGKTYNDFVDCYEYLVEKVDKIAISFDYSFFEEWTAPMRLPTKYHQWMYGRRQLIEKMLEDDVMWTAKPHHLLGCGLPQEFISYRGDFWLDSIDTSNPVVAGIKGYFYNGVKGLETKPSEKLFTMINYIPDNAQMLAIEYNINTFYRIVNDA